MEKVIPASRLSPTRAIGKQEATDRLRPSLSRKILAITPKRAKRSCAPFTPGFLSGLRYWSITINVRLGNTHAHCSNTLFFLYARPISDEEALDDTSNHE